MTKVKRTAFILTFSLLLIAVSFASPIEATPDHTAAIAPRLQRELRSTKNEVALLIKGQHDLELGEVLALDALGTVTTVAGPVAVIHTTKDKVEQIQRLRFVSRIDGPRPLTVYLDQSVPDIGADAVRREVRDQFGSNVTGAGVVIGFVDTGIDLTHPDFSFPNGSTKILYVWDQTIEGRAPNDFPYGYECSSRDIEGRKCPEFDSFGHGTHVAGIAAGSGQATGRLRGVAPDAGIIFVKSGHAVCDGANWTFESPAELVDGFSYIVKRAAQLGRRAVINISFGGNTGSHDGTDPLELALDAFVKSGIPVVVSAGNSARDNGHARGQLSQGTSITLDISVQQTTTDLIVDVWYSPADQMTAALNTPQGETYALTTPPSGASTIYGNITVAASSSDLGNELYLEVKSDSPLPSDGWSVILEATRINEKGSWDAWIDTTTCSYPGASFVPGSAYTVDPYGTVGFPGAAREVITVGAYTTKNSWDGLSGETFGSSAFRIGDIAPFSSLGPTRDGRIKPDVVAPGLFIASARSNLIATRSSDPDAFHRILAGTSMAAPHVAGAIALMIQYAPRLEAVEIAKILRETARQDARTDLVSNGSPIWGFGKIDVRTATGFFRLTLIIDGLSKSVTAPVLVDDKKTSEISGSAWYDFYFLKGTTHTVALESELPDREGVRYKLVYGRFTVTANSLRTVTYKTQYLLTVNSEFGPTTGTGWYDANATARISAPGHVTVPGLLAFTGVEYVLSHWTTDDGGTTHDLVKMDRPNSVTAVYVLTFTVRSYVLLLLVASISVVAILIAKRIDST